MKTAIMLVILLAVLPVPVWADDVLQAEIAHLIAYIGGSDCIFERNEKAYGREEALQHIREKYEYFKADIGSAERFIDLCASKSILSGKPYLIRCPGEPPVESRRWLLDELLRFRATAR